MIRLAGIAILQLILSVSFVGGVRLPFATNGAGSISGAPFPPPLVANMERAPRRGLGIERGQFATLRLFQAKSLRLQTERR